MSIIAKLLIGLIAFIHIYILWFEMFAWETKGPKIFSTFDRTLFPKTKAMAANQGLYNGFLAAGLIWSLLIKNTDSKKIIFVQIVPAVIAILVLLIN